MPGVEERDGQQASDAGVGRVGLQGEVERGGRPGRLLGVDVGHAERVLHLWKQRIERRSLFEELGRAGEAAGLRLHDPQVQVRAGKRFLDLRPHRGALDGRQQGQRKRHVDGREGPCLRVGDVGEIARHLFARRFGAVRDEALRFGEVVGCVSRGARGAQRPAQLVVDARDLRLADACGLTELQRPLQWRHGVGRAVEGEQAPPEVVERVSRREFGARGEFERRQRLVLAPCVNERRAEPEVVGASDASICSSRRYSRMASSSRTAPSDIVAIVPR